MNKIKLSIAGVIALVQGTFDTLVSKLKGEPTTVADVHTMRTKVQTGIDSMIQRKQEDTLYCIARHSAIVTDLDESISANREKTAEKIAVLQEKSLGVTSALKEAGATSIWHNQLNLTEAQGELRELKEL